MKYTILGFQQTKLIENGLTIEDAFILRTIKDMYSSASMEFKDFESIRCMWVNYTYFLEQIPILKTKRTLMRRIECYGNKHLITRNLVYSHYGKKGKFSYIAPTVKLDSLQDYDLMTNSHKVYDKIAQGDMTNSHNKDTSIKIDTSIIDNITTTTEIEKVIPPKEIIKKLVGFDAVIKEFTSNPILKETIIDFVKMRKANKKVITDHALNLMLTKLNKLATNDELKVDIINQSILGCWTDIYKIKDEAVNKHIVHDFCKKESTFNNFPQREYDYVDLEKKLLGED